MTREAVLRTLVYAGLIALSILLWWALLKLFIDAGPLPQPVPPGAG
jgi:hypothetical protein